MRRQEQLGVGIVESVTQRTRCNSMLPFPVSFFMQTFSDHQDRKLSP
ncbi:unnamed protein product [Ixodes persulcatus]